MHLSLLQCFILYLLAINIVTFGIYGIDKYKSRHEKWRIPEATLLLLAAIGGSIGAFTAMRLFHHKTLHKKFKWGVPAIFFAQLALLLLTSCATTNNSFKRNKATDNMSIQIGTGAYTPLH